MLVLNELTKLVKKKKRVGRGGSRGGTSGRGHKGQKARSGGAPKPGFEGGQMPLHRRLPKRGFNNKRFKKDVSIVSLDVLNQFFAAQDSVSIQDMVERGLIRSRKQGSEMRTAIVKVLAGQKPLDRMLTIHAHRFSKQARAQIETTSGAAVTVDL